MLNKKEKGITLISMVIAIIVMLIIIASISYSSRNGFKLKNLENLYGDIDSLTDSVSIYYAKNKNLPVYYSSYSFDGKSQNFSPITIKNEKNGNNFYFNFKEKNRDESYISYSILDLTKLQNISLNYKSNIPEGIETGTFFKNTTSDKNILKDSIQKGIYVINLHTNHIYYTKAVSVDGEKYYTKGENAENIPNYSKVTEQTKEDDEIGIGKDYEKTSGITIKFFGNGGVNVPDEFYITSESLNINSSLLNHINEDFNSKGSVPSKTGMNFLGWGTTNDSLTFKYSFSGSKYGNNFSMANNAQDITLPNSKYPDGSTISLYAIWGVNDNYLSYYYASGTSGINPVNSDNTLSRVCSKEIPEATSSYLYIDIPSSGYTISWNWTSDDYKEAVYEGNSMSQTLSKINKRENSYTAKNTYTTTESGAMKLKGSFTNFKVTLEDGSKVKLSYDKTNVIKICKMNNLKRKDYAGDVVKLNSKDLEWLVGKDGSFTVPSDYFSYKAMNITDPSGGYNYVSPNNSDATYYLKKIVLINKDELKKEIKDYDSSSRSYELGSMVTLPNDKSSKTYYIYPVFGAKNYEMSYSSTYNFFKYQESLEEAYNDALKNSSEKYTLTVLNNVDNANKVVEEYKYNPAHDPTYNKNLNFNSNIEITIDMKSYTINRMANFQISNGILNITSTSKTTKGGMNFSKCSSECFNIDKSDFAPATVNIDGGIELKKNSDSSMFILSNYSKLSILEANLINNYTSESQSLIKLNGRSAILCLGCTEEYKLNDGTYDVKDLNITNNNGNCIECVDDGTICWKYGILNTSNLKFKAGYTDGTENNIRCQRGLGPCIYVDNISSSTPMYKTKVDENIWKFYDMDSGVNRFYQTSTLQSANDLINLKNNNITMEIECNPKSDVLTNQSATITKPVTITYKNGKPINVSDSKLYIQNNVTIKNYRTNECDNSYINITKDGTLNLESSYIISHDNGNLISNTGGILNIDLSNNIETVSGINQSGSTAVTNLKGKIETTTGKAIENREGSLFVESAVVSSDSNYAINNRAYCEIIGGTVTSNNSTAIYNDSNKSENIVYKSSSIKGKTGIYVAGGTLKVGIGYIRNSKELSNSSTVTSGPTIHAIGTSSTNAGIYLQNGEVTIGVNDNKYNPGKPTIKGKKYGIRVNAKAGSKFNFYDGYIFGTSSGGAFNPKNLDSLTNYFSVPNNYKVSKDSNSRDYVDNVVTSGEKATLVSK